MINYSLRCAAGHGFDGWFKDSAAYDAQAEAGSLRCPFCDSTEVEKAIMAPAVARGRRGGGGDDTGDEAPKLPVAAVPAAPPASLPPEAAKMLAMARAFRAHVERHAENVGPRFASEARAMHVGDKEARAIWGQASGEEVESLLDDGIEIAPLPDVPKLNG